MEGMEAVSEGVVVKVQWVGEEGGGEWAAVGLEGLGCWVKKKKEEKKKRMGLGLNGL